jgi:uncharacterized flavoprotein (TIGR03862 family)
LDIDAEHGDVVIAPIDAKEIAIVGAGPAGLFAAEIIARAGHRVTIYERMPSPARKFLMAGRGGLNLTHNEPLETFLNRYGDAANEIRSAVEAFPPLRLIDWANGLGTKTFVGTSGRVFPEAMKASPLLRAWLKRLEALGVAMKTRHRWIDFGEMGELLFDTPDGPVTIKPDASVFALGGGSWPKLGSDGGWVDPFRRVGIATAELTPANCGVLVSWSDSFRSRFEGVPLKRIAISIDHATSRGEAIISKSGLEGGAIYSIVPAIRRVIAANETEAPKLTIDLKPDSSHEALAARLARRRPKETLTNFLRKAAHLEPAAIALLREGTARPSDNPDDLATDIKALRIPVAGLSGLERAISTAGGISWDQLDARLMIKSVPGVFVAGEMLDWEATTGGYLLQGTYATAAAAANGLLDSLATQQ